MIGALCTLSLVSSGLGEKYRNLALCSLARSMETYSNFPVVESIVMGIIENTYHSWDTCTPVLDDDDDYNERPQP